jgi:V8-like Glu-specific endopeptidase
MELSITEQLSYSTMRIECKYNDGSSATGTGYYFRFKDDKVNNRFIPVIITNKHVIDDSINGKLTFTKANDNGEPIDNEHFDISIDNFEAFWRKHPDKDVDLCAMPFQPFISKAEEVSLKPFYIGLETSLIPKEEQLKELSAMEEIVMVGYPNGIWDQLNNKPIFRKGITATHRAVDYNGRKEFLIDAACFPGSSGSPVFLLNEGGYRDKKGNTYMGTTWLYLLGTLYAGPQQTVEGNIQIVDVPVVNKPIALSNIPINLGIIIKASRIFELEGLF